MHISINFYSVKILVWLYKNQVLILLSLMSILLICFLSFYVIVNFSFANFDSVNFCLINCKPIFFWNIDNTMYSILVRNIYFVWFCFKITSSIITTVEILQFPQGISLFIPGISVSLIFHFFSFHVTYFAGHCIFLL